MTAPVLVRRIELRRMTLRFRHIKHRVVAKSPATATLFGNAAVPTRLGNERVRIIAAADKAHRTMKIGGSVFAVAHFLEQLVDVLRIACVFAGEPRREDAGSPIERGNDQSRIIGDCG